MRPRPVPRARKSTLSIGPLLAAPRVLQALGADVRVVLREAGFTAAQFDDPESQISYRAMGRLFSRGVAHTGCDHLGLLVGQEGGLQSLGVVGLLVKYSKDVETALRCLERHFHLQVRGATILVELAGTSVRVGHVIYSPAESTEQISDGALAEVFNVLRAVCGPAWKPTEVQLARRAPADVRPYRRFFGPQVQFDAEMHAVVFSADWLRHPLPATDKHLKQLLMREIEKLQRVHPDDFPRQVRSVLRSSLATGEVGIGQVSALFSMHSRTLARRLERHDTSFRELLEDARFECARQMLADTSLDLARISIALGYARPSVFIRSFRRWSGTTPAAWRDTLASDA